MEMTSRVELFNYAQPPGASVQSLDVDAIWRAIDGLQEVTLMPASDYVARAGRSVQFSADAIILHEARAAKEKLAKALAARVAAERGVAAREKQLEDAGGAVKDAEHRVLAYDKDVARLAELRASATREQVRLGRLGLLSRALLWSIAPIAAFSAYALQSMNLTMAGFGVPFLALLTSYYFSSRRHEVTIALARDIEGLRASVDLGVGHRQREATLRQAEFRAAKDDLTQRQGVLYQAMVGETEAREGLVPEDRVLTAETAIAARQQVVRQAYDTALARYQAVARELAHGTVRWREHRDEAQRLCWAIRNLETRRASEHRKARAEAREQQLADHLDRYFIAHEKWKGVPKAALSALASFGIETAADIEHDAVIKVPGFGAVRTKALVNWRRQKEATFKFNPNKSDQGNRVQAVNRRIDAERQTHERGLTKAKRQLDAIHSALEQRRTSIDQMMNQAAEQLAKAQADLQAVKGNKAAPPPVPTDVHGSPPAKPSHVHRRSWWQKMMQR